MNNNSNRLLPVDDNKVINYVIDVYLWVQESLNTCEVRALGQHIIDLADRRATDVELVYINNRYPEESYPAAEDIVEPQYATGHE